MDKVGNGIEVSGSNTLIKTENGIWRVAIADGPIDAQVDGKKFFCVRVDGVGNSMITIGFTPKETFDSNKKAFLGHKGVNGCGMFLLGGSLYYPVGKYHNIIDGTISNKAKEIIVILIVSNNGKKKEIRFLCDGHESKSFDVSDILEGDRIFPAICLARHVVWYNLSGFSDLSDLSGLAVWYV